MNRPEEITAMPPTPALVEAACLLEDTCLSVIKSIGKLDNIRYYESSCEAKTLGYVVVRQVESIAILAKRDLVTIPAALVICRSILEMTARILWLLQPESHMQREARWLALLGGEANYLQRLGEFQSTCGQDSTALLASAKSIAEFKKAIEDKLPGNVSRLKGLPDFRSILKELNREPMYAHFMQLSQYTHGGTVASRFYKRDLGTAKQFGEHIYPETWAQPFAISWYCITELGQSLVSKLGNEADKFLSDAFLRRGRHIISKV